jgi:Fe2+ transport system protein B
MRGQRKGAAVLAQHGQAHFFFNKLRGAQARIGNWPGPVAVIRQESKLGFTALAMLWPLAVAWMVSLVYYQIARALGG